MVKKKPVKRYFKNIKKKKHEAGWPVLLKIGVIAFFIFMVLALAFGNTLPITRLLTSGLQVAVLVIMLIVFIIGIITVTENTKK